MTPFKFYSLQDGYPGWGDSLSDCEIFSSLEEAQSVTKSNSFTKPTKMTNGDIYPPRLIHIGADLNSKHPKGDLLISISRIDIIPQAQMIFQGEIKKGGMS